MHGRLDRKTFLTTLGAAGLGLGLTTAAGVTPARAHEHAPSGGATHPADAGGMSPLDERLQRRTTFYRDFTAALAVQLQRAPQSGQESSPGEPIQRGEQPGESGATASPGARNPNGTSQNSRDRGRAPSAQGGPATGPGGATQGSEQPGQNGAGPSGTAPSATPSGADWIDAAIRRALMDLIDARQEQGGLTYGQAEALKTLVATDAAPIAPEPISLLWLGASPVSVAGGQPGPASAPAAQGRREQSAPPAGAGGNQSGPGGQSATSGGVSGQGETAPEQGDRGGSRRRERTSGGGGYP